MRAILDYMTPSPMTIEDEEPLELAARVMTEKRIRHLPVTRQGSLAGVLTQNDVHLAMLKANYARHNLRVKDAASQRALVVDPTDSLEAVTRRLVDGHHCCALVVERGQVKGIFTSLDALRSST